MSNSLIFVPPNLSQEGEEDTPEMMMIEADRFSFLTRLFLILLLIVSGASQLPFSRVSAGLSSQRSPETVIFAVSREGAKISKQHLLTTISPRAKAIACSLAVATPAV